MQPELETNIAENGQSDAGLSLLELVVAVFVMAVGTLAVLTAVDQSGITITQEKARLLAGVVADNRAEELRLPGGRALPAEVTMGGLRFRITETLRGTEGGFTEATIRAQLAEGNGGPGALRITWIASPNAGPGL
ncbi:type II secretion system (T2SS) protein I [Shimia isoporae]|uniref:Type II secretion system (T2SS) protein I n=1 Tax=Shimia isoporae TaxID=647720 RepID=A0A4R1N314_9RHOB|nr:type II secretion system protein [Shimia isoporae]TCK99861.1 type II secretion system (T2SS) protein I [Shimia isoporae]